MTLRKILTAGVAMATMAAVPSLAQDTYPTHPVIAIVPFPAGGATGNMARAAARELTDILGVNVPVQNIGGGAGTIGTAQLARSKPDGYTIGILGAAPLIVQPHMRKTVYSIEDFTYICQLFSSPHALVIKPDSPFKSLKDVVDYAAAHPGELSYGTPGPGSLPHLAMEAFLKETGVNIKHVPFQGDGPGVTALLGGHVDLYMGLMSVVLQNDLKSVAVFADERVESLPDVPTSVEQGFTTVALWWGGMFGPKDMPDEVNAKLETACEAVAKNDRYKETLHKLGTSVVYKNGATVKKMVEESSAANAEILKTISK